MQPHAAMLLFGQTRMKHPSNLIRSRLLSDEMRTQVNSCALVRWQIAAFPLVHGIERPSQQESEVDEVELYDGIGGEWAVGFVGKIG